MSPRIVLAMDYILSGFHSSDEKCETVTLELVSQQHKQLALGTSCSKANAQSILI